MIRLEGRDLCLQPHICEVAIIFCLILVEFSTMEDANMFATITPEKVGENLKRLIKESEYRTQERFAEEAFVDVRTVRRWVQKGIDSISTIAMVADILDVDVKALLF